MRQVFVIIFLAVFVGLSSTKEWYETAAFYQIYPQSFYDDGSGKSGTGTFKGIQSKLDYLRDLGIDCLWLTPIFQSSFNSYGYDITDYKAIDPRYGSLEDFENLIKAVHEKGMKIIVDFVPNHCGVEHPFFKKSVEKDPFYKDWFVWTDKINYRETVGDREVVAPTNWQSIGGEPGSAWTKSDERNEFYYAQFNHNMPDFNLRNEEVKKYLKEVMTFWLDRELDGFRVDAISHGVEVKPDSEGKYPNEERNLNENKRNSFDYLIHSYTQDQPELFDIIYDWRQFLNSYQKEKKTNAK